MSEIIYAALDLALADIARRSFYENARVTKTDAGYVVEDWHTGVEEIIDWTYEAGIAVEHIPHLLDYSRLHEAYEFYDKARHISHNVPAAVEAIESGVPVGFTYVQADAPCEDGPDECDGDHVAGWALIATREG